MRSVDNFYRNSKWFLEELSGLGKQTVAWDKVCWACRTMVCDSLWGQNRGQWHMTKVCPGVLADSSLSSCIEASLVNEIWNQRQLCSSLGRSHQVERGTLQQGSPCAGKWGNKGRSEGSYSEVGSKVSQHVRVPTLRYSFLSPHMGIVLFHKILSRWDRKQDFFDWNIYVALNPIGCLISSPRKHNQQWCIP